MCYDEETLTDAYYIRVFMYVCVYAVSVYVCYKQTMSLYVCMYVCTCMYQVPAVPVEMSNTSQIVQYCLSVYLGY